jgi:hypothetical protein
MGKHVRSGRLFRLRYPVLAVAAVLAVAGVSSVLVDRGAPAAPVRAGGRAPAAAVLAGSEAVAAASSSASGIYGCATSGGGFSFLTVTAASACPPTVSGVSRQVQPTRPSRARSHTVRPKVTPKATSSSPPAGGPQYFGLAPLGTPLPRSDAYCAAHVQPVAENVPANEAANHDTPPAGTSFDWGPSTTTSPGLEANFAHVDGNFSGTTGEILEWAACKWGWDEDYAKAEAVIESVWKQSQVNGNAFGILQVSVSQDGDSPSANSGWGGYPWVQQSTAVNADAQMAYLRSCYDGDMPGLGNGYHAGDAWGCIGSWFSGQWDSSAGNGYISDVQGFLNNQTWLNL